MNWIDGHLTLAAFVSPILAFLAVGYANHRLRLRVAKRQQIFGGAR